jgi:hypothetical protein
LKQSKFIELQIIYALKQEKGGIKVEKDCQKMGISETRNFTLGPIPDHKRG